jgi:hypothetical protein
MVNKHFLHTWMLSHNVLRIHLRALSIHSCTFYALVVARVMCSNKRTLHR